MKKYVASVHEGKKPFQCKICEYSCPQRYHLKQHIASMHEREKPLSCQLCNYSSSTLEALIAVSTWVFILEKKSTQHGLIRDHTFIDF